MSAYNSVATSELLGTAFDDLSNDASWQTGMDRILINECLNFAHRVLTCTVSEHPERMMQTANAIKQAFIAINKGLHV